MYIDVGNVAELKSLTTEPNLILGGNVSLTEAMDTFYRISEENASYKYTKALGDHIDLIANVPVRNVSTPLRYVALLLKISVCLDVTLCSWISGSSTNTMLHLRILTSSYLKNALG